MLLQYLAKQETRIYRRYDIQESNFADLAPKLVAVAKSLSAGETKVRLISADIICA